MDVNRDGFIDESDLKAIHNDLGRNPSAAELKEMLKECPGQLNFTAFLTLFGEKMHGKHISVYQPALRIGPLYFIATYTMYKIDAFHFQRFYSYGTSNIYRVLKAALSRFWEDNSNI